MSSNQETHQRLDRKSLRELVRDGKWEEIIKCLSRSTKPDHPIFFKIYHHMYLKAVYKKEFSKALRIYKTKLQEFYEPSKHEHFKELKHLMDLADPRENKNFAEYWDNRMARNISEELHAPMVTRQCLSLRLPDEEPVWVTGLLYINSGAKIIALRADGVHHLWKWPKQHTYKQKRDACENHELPYTRHTP
ncbi:topless-related protein 4 [Artemisia annua]|uniref:Topless-related protein 4 n=1 Tax=Artemisia annua TaxID=35608 RepID=A0A2U1NDE5_ARTAN|nr:topless-related protein 4 [Artemisia annua]